MIKKHSKEKSILSGLLESPKHVRTSIAAAMTMGLVPGKFYRDAKLHCLNLLLTYKEGCAANCAYCGLSRGRQTGKEWKDQSFIRVDWPIVSLDEVIESMQKECCSHVERVCISMITNGRSVKDTLLIVEKLHTKTDRISALITPTIIDKKWLFQLKKAGVDMVGIAIDTVTANLFDEFRGRNVKAPHRWKKYWKTVKEAVEVFGRGKVGVHLIAGLGEKEKEMVETIQRAQEMGAKTHLFSFFPEERSAMQNHVQPPIGKYRRIQLARYLINCNLTELKRMTFDEKGRLLSFGVDQENLGRIINEGTAFMTSGCEGESLENACNRPFANCTPHQALMGEMRNFPFQPNREDIEQIKKQILNY
jgi:biotin synthase